MSSGDVLVLSTPSLDGRVLESSSIREGKRPGSLDVGDLVDGVEVKGSILFALST